MATLLFGTGLTGLIAAYTALLVFDMSQLAVLVSEDGLIESLGALFFGLAGGVFVYLYVKTRARTVMRWPRLKGNVFFLLLGIAMLFVAMEEISWGQRIIRFPTPEAIRSLNLQEEFNIHNLWLFHGKTETGERKSFWALMLNMDRLFSLFWFTFCFVIPLLAATVVPIRKFLETMPFPIPPLYLGILFVANYIVSKTVVIGQSGPFQHWSVEIKESIIALLFLLVSIWFLQRHRANLGEEERRFSSTAGESGYRTQ